MLERDEARRLHSSSFYEVAQLKAHVDYLQVALQVVEEEVTKAWSVATTARVPAYGKLLATANSQSLGFCSWVLTRLYGSQC